MGAWLARYGSIRRMRHIKMLGISMPRVVTLDDSTKAINVLLPYSAFQEENALRLVISRKRTGQTLAAAELIKIE